jgi:hypothetical protein
MAVMSHMTDLVDGHSVTTRLTDIFFHYFQPVALKARHLFTGMLVAMMCFTPINGIVRYPTTFKGGITDE